MDRSPIIPEHDFYYLRILIGFFFLMVSVIVSERLLKVVHTVLFLHPFRILIKVIV